MAVAIRVGSGPGDWMADPRALATAVEMLDEADRKAKARR